MDRIDPNQGESKRSRTNRKNKKSQGVNFFEIKLGMRKYRDVAVKIAKVKLNRSVYGVKQVELSQLIGRIGKIEIRWGRQ